MSRQNWHFRKKIRQVVQKYNFNQLLSNAFCPILIINQKILGAMVINMDLESTIVSIIRYQYAEIMNASAQDLGNNGDRIKEFASILTNIITCNQNLFKLPLFYLIDKNYRKEPADKLS